MFRKSRKITAPAIHATRADWSGKIFDVTFRDGARAYINPTTGMWVSDDWSPVAMTGNHWSQLWILTAGK